jgi:hypothetical protein
MPTFHLLDRPKFTQIGILVRNICHLATLVGRGVWQKTKHNLLRMNKQKSKDPGFAPQLPVKLIVEIIVHVCWMSNTESFLLST